jgi:hypothetical protein
MIRSALLLVAVPVLLFATDRSLEAQANLRASKLDVGVYAGAVHHTDWFDNAGAAGRSSWSPGTTGAVGVTASYRLSPSFGIRASGLFGRSSLPGDSAAGGDPTVVTEVYGMDGFWWPPLDKPTGKIYVFAGGGVHTARVTGGPSSRPCVAVTEGAAAGACIPRDRTSTAQGNVGVGMDLLSTGAVTVFGEAAVHGFNSPVRVSGQADEDKFVTMPRVVVGAKVRLL